MSEKNRARFGLLGRNINYSFSRAYFNEKFERENLSLCSYENFDVPNLKNVKKLLKTTHLKGLNVTIPYKEEVMPFLDELDEVALKIGAVNTVVFRADGTTKGYNTDYIGFQKSVLPLLSDSISAALILGTGGASKAVMYALTEIGITTQYVSRKKSENTITYKDLNLEILNTHQLIVNCTPLGTYPNVEMKPEIDYTVLTEKHVLFDLIYNPSETAFMKEGRKNKAAVCSGKQMLVEQAEAAWKLWNS